MTPRSCEDRFAEEVSSPRGGHITIALGLGAFAPPLGVGLYATLAVERRSLSEAAAPWLRYVGVVLVGLALVVLVPAISTWLPALSGRR